MPDLYAELADVKARMGALAAALTDTSTPGPGEVEIFIRQVSAQVDSALAGRGLTLPLTDDVAKESLRGVVADGALLLTVAALFPNREGPAAARQLIEMTEERYKAAWKAIGDGVYPSVDGSEGEGTSASNFWTSEPDYGVGIRAEDADANYRLYPTFARGDSF